MQAIALFTSPLPPKDLQDIMNQFINSFNTGPLGVIGGSAVQTATIADTNETTLGSFNIPANYLQQNKGVRITAFGATGATANNKTMKLYYGAAVVTTPTAATNAKGWFLQLVVLKSGTNTQAILGSGLVDVTPVSPYTTAGAETETAAVLTKVTGTNGTAAANDILCKGYIVEALF